MLRSVSTTDEYTSDPAAAGYGKINPYAGLCYLLQVGGIEDIQALPRAILYPSVGHGEFSILPAADADDAVIEIYTMAGVQIYRRHITGCTAGVPVQVALPASPSGMYVVRMQTQEWSEVFRYLIE